MLEAECVDCITEGVTNWRPIKTGKTKRSKRCYTHTRARRKANSNRRHEAHVAKAYGAPQGWYDKQLEIQGGTCAICGPWSGRNGTTKRMATDHNHATGERRGLLCSDCNRMLGRLGDRPEAFERAAEYLRNPPARAQAEPCQCPVDSMGQAHTAGCPAIAALLIPKQRVEMCTERHQHTASCGPLVMVQA